MNDAFSLRLRAARLGKGLTQQHLADMVGLSKQAISQYEKGQKRPDSRIFLALAHALGKAPDVLIRPLRPALGELAFRKKSSLKGRHLQSLQAAAIEHLESYLELEALMGAELVFENPLAGLLIRDMDDVELAAERLIAAWDLGHNPIPNVLEMLENRQVKVIEVEQDERFDGLAAWAAAQPFIVLNAAQPLLRKRFTALHELGHLLLSFPDEADEHFIERACHRFAGALLLPAPVLLASLGAKRQQLSLAELGHIKAYRGVSLAAIVYRAKDLGILSQALFERFWRLRRQDRDLELESGPLYGHYLGEERPMRFGQMLSKALAEGLVSMSKAAALSGQPVAVIQRDYMLI